MAPAPARFDHLVIGAADLARGVAAIQTRLGVAPGGYGAHAAMGTHNALWRLDAAPAADGAPVPAYLEVIAIDPAAPAPGRPRWFGLDDPAVAASLAGGP
ncbi:MAG: VOC family protein, partial [Pseudomonadota bacterium]